MVETNERGDHRVYCVELDGSITEIVQEGNGVTNDEVVAKYQLPGDNVVEVPSRILDELAPSRA